MRNTFLLLAILCLTTFATGQAYNAFHVFDGSTEYTSRGTIGTNEGEILNRVHGKHTLGLGKIHQVYMLCQDQNNTTLETYELIFRKADATGKPDISSTGIIKQYGPYSISGTGTGGATAWGVTITLPADLDVPDSDFYVGVKVPASPNWSSDGFSIHMSGYYSASPCGEHHRQGVKPEMAFCVDYQNGAPITVTEPTNNRVFRFELRTDGKPTLQSFAVDPAADLIPGGAGCPAKKDTPDLGTAGLWPDLLDLEQYGYKAKFGWRIRQGNAASGLGIVFLSGSLFPLPLATPWGGKFYLNPSDIYFTGLGGQVVMLDTAGQGDTLFFNPPDAVRVALVGSFLYAQALCIDPTTPTYSLTNMTGTSF